MDHVGVVLAGCAPGTGECVEQVPYPGIDTWFVLLVLGLLVLAVAGIAVFLVRRLSRRRVATAASTDDAVTRA